jgi:5,10-methylenetetrahydromethanopterin reductase
VADAGADAVFLQHVGSYDLPHALLAHVADQVLPLLPVPVCAAR